MASVVPNETTVSVTAYEDETGDVDDWGITAFAACAARPDDDRILRSESAEKSIGVRTQLTSCPHGTVPLGLGWAVSEGPARPSASSAAGETDGQ